MTQGTPIVPNQSDFVNTARTLTAERLRELLHYDPDTGIFTWRVKRNHMSLAGGIAGHICGRGYVTIRVAGHRYRAHRLAWLYVNGVWPDSLLDHKNRVRNDNRIINLRQATDALSIQNRGMNKNNRSGIKGVSWHRGARKWVAQITLRYRNIYLGLFDTADKAAAAYQEAQKKMHPFARVQS